MTCVTALNTLADLHRDARVAWLNERPKVISPSENEAEYIPSLRVSYRYHETTKGQLETMIRQLRAMTEDCEIAMNECVTDALQYQEIEA